MFEHRKHKKEKMIFFDCDKCIKQLDDMVKDNPIFNPPKVKSK